MSAAPIPDVFNLTQLTASFVSAIGIGVGMGLGLFLAVCAVSVALVWVFPPARRAAITYGISYAWSVMRSK